MQERSTSMKVVFAARDFAVRMHGDQKYGSEPYMSHLDEVATLCLLHLPTLGVEDVHGAFRHLIVDCLVLSYLHDVLEDTAATKDTVSSLFGDAVAEQCGLLSDPPGENRRDRKAKLHRQLGSLDDRTETGAVVLGVKVMDRLANVRRSAAGRPDLLEMYRRESAAFRKAAFRTGMCLQAWVELDRLSSP